MTLPQCMTWAQHNSYNSAQKSEITHNALDGRISSLGVPDDKMDEFLRLCTLDIIKDGHSLFFSETADPDHFRLFFDLDIKSRNPISEELLVRPILRVIGTSVTDLYSYLENPDILAMYILTRKKKVGFYLNDPTSAGYHVHVPGIITNVTTAAQIRSVSY